MYMTNIKGGQVLKQRAASRFKLFKRFHIYLKLPWVYLWKIPFLAWLNGFLFLMIIVIFDFGEENKFFIKSIFTKATTTTKHQQNH